MDDEEPPLKENKLPIEATLNVSLPDDLLVSILARVSRLYYPTLSLVSKRFRSLLTSSELYQTRSLLGCTENCLYVCLLFSYTERILHWFMLGRRPNQRDAMKKNKSSGYVLARLPIPNSPPVNHSGLVAVGYNIYNIGRSIHDSLSSSISPSSSVSPSFSVSPSSGVSPSFSVSPSSSVSILDCRSHRWLEAPSMQVERDYLSASFLDGKIYVTGGCYKNYNPSNWMEVFDIKNNTWEPVLSPAGRLTLPYRRDQTINEVVDGKLYIIADKGVVYNPKDGSWNSLGPEMNLGWKSFSSCVIENVLYHYHYVEGIKWYDTKVRSWRPLNGMGKLPKLPRCAKLADYGGKLALFWDKFVASSGGYPKSMLWCAVIALEKRNNEEIWGTVEWFDSVLPHSIPMEYVFVYVATVNV